MTDEERPNLVSLPARPDSDEFDLAGFLAGVKQLAQVQRGLFDAYIAEGFSEDQALRLAAYFLRPGGSGE